MPFFGAPAAKTPHARTTRRAHQSFPGLPTESIGRKNLSPLRPKVLTNTRCAGRIIMLWAAGAASGDRRKLGQVSDPVSDPDGPPGLFGREPRLGLSWRKAETPARVGETRGGLEFLDQTGRGPASRKVSRGRPGNGKEHTGLPREPEGFAAQGFLFYRLREPVTLGSWGICLFLARTALSRIRPLPVGRPRNLREE